MRRLKQPRKTSASLPVRRIAATLAAAFLVAGVLAGCFSDEVTVDYRGPLDGEVAACAEIASAGYLRDDLGVPSRIWIDNVAAREVPPFSTVHFTYEVSAQTHASTQGRQTYDWTCTVTLDLQTQTLVAELTSFQRANP